MGLTLDNILAVCRVTIFHPIASLLLPGILILSAVDPVPLKISTDSPAVQWVSPFSARLVAAFCCVVFSWLLQWNRAMNHKALNPGPKVTYDWPKEVIVVTGGSKGIGGELVQKLERLGATVAVMDVIPLTFEPGTKTHYFKANVASFEDVSSVYKKIVAELGMPTVLVANAGVVKGRTILEASELELRTTFDVNVLGVIFCIKVFLPSMIAADCGHILVTSSATAFGTVASVTDYSASKAAVTSIVEGLQTELKHKYGNPRVKASAIFPATVATEMFKGIDQRANGFTLPVLQPGQVAERMLQTLLNGRSEMVIMPAMSNAISWLRVLPYWMRVGFQDVGAHTMDNLSVAKTSSETMAPAFLSGTSPKLPQ